MLNRTPARSLPYALVDVFAEHALEGNMLAIFHDARGLTTEQMQALARETNLAETTFIFPHESSQADAHRGVNVRIFTTQEELPFAGNPTLGTASWLYANHPTLRGAETITLRLAGGDVPVRFSSPASEETGVFGTMRQHDPTFGKVHDPAEVAQLLGVPIDDLDPSLPSQTVSTGLPFCIVPFRSVAALSRLAIPQAATQAWLEAADAKFFFSLAPSDIDGGAGFRCRMQFYNGEDPATGSAAGCAIAWLVRHSVVPSERPTIFAQGVEILRPSRLHVKACRVGDRISDVFVGGRTIQVASGQFFLP